MKPITAAAKLGIYLPAAPEQFQLSPITREALDELRADPPPWLVELRRNGPFPRDVLAAKLGISRAGLSRGGIVEALTADQVGALLADPPAWLVKERETHKSVVEEQAAARRPN